MPTPAPWNKMARRCDSLGLGLMETGRAVRRAINPGLLGSKLEGDGWMLRMYTATTTGVAAAKAGVGRLLSGQVRKLREDECGATAFEYGLIS